MRAVATAASLAFLLALSGASARDEGSLTDFEPGSPGREKTLPEPETNDVAALKEKLLVAQATIKNLSEGIAAANMEAEIFKRQLAETQLRLEAIGLSNVDNDPSRLEARLLQAIRELRVLKEQNQSASEQLVRLSEAITILVKSSAGLKPEARMDVEAELRKTAEILGAASAATPGAIPATLQDAMVVDFKEDLSLLVANVGSVHGVKVGMPFRILRDGQPIGNAKVIDVRERISGAVVQNLNPEDIRVEKGDALQVDARK
ncbi:MAG: hypothetical protein ACKOAS_04985 [Verrucomicrobiota bacterium]